MKWRLLAALAAAALLAADAPAPDKDKTDKDKLQGSWRVGATDGPVAELTGWRFEVTTWRFEGDSLTQVVVNPAATTRVPIEGKTSSGCVIDPCKTPKTIDVTPSDGPQKGKTWKGIYLLQDDALIVCRTREGGERPTDFTADAKKGQELILLKRIGRAGG